MPKHLPEDHPLSDGYADAQAREMRDARLRAKDYQHRWHGKWAEERARPISQRRFCSFGEIAERLARDPGSLTANPELRERIVRDLVERAQTQQFAAGEVVMLGGNPPEFRPLDFPGFPAASGGIIVLPDDEALALRRDACRRHVKARTELPGAAGLLREWFAAQRGSGKPELTDAIESVIAQHGHPGRTVPWKRFCDLVRTQCRVTAEVRGWGDKTIKRTVQAIGRDKEDIADMSHMSC